MSFNQSKAEKSEGQLRRTGRSGSFGQHRGFSGGGKGGVPAPPPHSSSNHASLSSNRSFKKSGNVQGGHHRVNPASAGPVAGAAVSSNIINQAIRNGAHVQAPSQGSLDAVAPSGSKPTEVSRNSSALPKVRSSQSAAVASDSAAPATPGKGNASKQFTLQFGIINPGIVNGMQIPARTSSAPPNLDEQKRDQARHDSFRAVPTLPLPAAPRYQPQETKKDGVKQSGPGESHPQTQTKIDVRSQVPASSSKALQKSSVLPVAGMPMPMPFQQTQIPFQFGGPDIQLQSQGLTASSLQMPLTLPVGNAAQVPQQMFIPGLQSHPIQPQALMHQGQGLGFAPQMGHQLPPQMSNMGIAIGQQFAQQQSGKFGVQRKTVKITHPETHEELRLDRRTDSYMDGGSSGQRQLPNLAPQSQPLSTLAPPHPINYYPPLQHNSYGPPPMFYPTATSVPLSSNQMTSQGPKHSFSLGQSVQPISFPNQSLNPITGSKTGPPLHIISDSVKLEASSLPTRSSSVQVSIKPSVSSNVDRIGKSSVTIAAPARNSEAPKVIRQISEVTPSPQSRGNDNSLESSVLLPKQPVPEPGSSKQSIASALSLQGTTPSTDVPEAAAAGTEDTRGPVCESYSSEDQPRKSDMLNAFGAIVQSSSMTMDDSKSADVVLPTKDGHTADVVSQTDNSQAISLPDTSTSGLSLSSPSEEYTIVSEVGTSESAEDETMLKPVVSLSCSNDLELKKALVSIEIDSAQTSTCSAPDVDETTSKNLNSSVPQNDHSLAEVVQKSELMKQERSEVSNVQVQDSNSAKVYPISNIGELTISAETGTSVKQEEVTGKEDPDKAIDSQSPSGEKQQLDTCMEEVSHVLEVDLKAEEFDGSLATSSDLTNSESDSSNHPRLVNAEVDKLPPPDTLISKTEVCHQDVGLSSSAVLSLETGSVQASVSSGAGQKVRGKITDSLSDNSGSAALSGPKDKPSLEPAKAKTTNTKKKKRRDLHKADLPGSSDLYNAYKGPEEKHETVSTLDSTNSSSSVDIKDASVNDLNQETVVNEDDGPSKSEVDDWEDAADISTPKLRTSESSHQVDGARKQHDKYGNETIGKKKYSRDFLLTFSEQCTQLPIGFEIGSDVVNAVMSCPVASSYVVDHEAHPSPGRSVDRSSGSTRVDRRTIGIVDDDRWTKFPGSFGPGQEIRHDIGHGATAMNLRPGQGITHGVLRNPRGQPSGQNIGGILSGPLQPMPLPGGVPRNGADADRWQRASNFQRGIPQTPMQVMHKATKKYEIGKVSDEEEAKQRQLKAILNKLTPQNFEKLFAQVKEVNIDNTVTLKGVISQIFDKALMEPTFCEMYASFCFHLATDLPDFIEDNEKVTFKRLLLNKCQEEFERGEREQAEADKAAEEGEIEQSEGEREEKRIKARRRMLGNIRLIGELYKKKMLTERIMHECIKKLLGQYQNPDEEDIEALCKLMSTIGDMIDHPKAKEHMDAYFDLMLKLSTNQKLSSRVRFMLKDAIDLRKNKWQQRRKVEGPKKIEEVHRDAAFERQAQASRSARGPVITSSSRRGAPVDYAPRGATGLSSQHMGGSRGFPPQSRAYGIQDVRSEDRHLFESRTLSVPLPQRPTDDDSITLGPQGGLARGMSIRGQPLVSNALPFAETPSAGENRRPALGPNGYHSTPYNSREEVTFRNFPDRSVGTSYDQSITVDRSSERPLSNAPSGRVQGFIIASQTVSSEAKPLSEEALKDKSLSAIREYYSAKDEEEVALCVKELNSPGFYPTMISLWVTDSFERKNMEREFLAMLLVNLCKSRERLLGHSQLVQGFQYVLSTLEDAVNDAPKAAEFLGQLFAKIILENVVPLADIGRLIREGGEEPGQLIEIGLASEVLGSVLEFIKLEKGDSVLNEIRAKSNLQLEDFRPPHPMKAKKLDAFL
ncbi:hypothetical protein J5N97_018708 [Dioscorea zingiberensis]|uniref:Eukaryotic translation initiation factor 4G n=1 Tax=Dioscorea zingiberensis TaxID=325984 RepID=A0A9D5CD36_9LILI|nr:hypothetical protein J5N97_018708 [Dioscorea zingiberensis]